MEEDAVTVEVDDLDVVVVEVGGDVDAEEDVEDAESLSESPLSARSLAG